MNNPITTFIRNNSEDIDFVTNALTLIVPVIMINLQGWLSPLTKSILTVVTGVCSIYVSRHRRKQEVENATPTTIEGVVEDGA